MRIVPVTRISERNCKGRGINDNDFSLAYTVALHRDPVLL
jgi:hypothetical protein